MAYLSGAEHFHGERWPEPGDMLHLETETEGDLRCARGVHLMGDASAPMLPRMLRDAVAAKPQPPHLSVVGAPVRLTASPRMVGVQAMRRRQRNAS